MNWKIVIICLFMYQCRFFDYRQEALTGTTFQERNWNKETNQRIYFFSSKLKNLPEGKRVSFRKYEYSFLSIYFGNMLGNTSYRDNFSDYFPIDNYKATLQDHQIIIIHNIQIKYNSNFLFDAFKTIGAMLLSYYNMEGELNIISEEEFSKFLKSRGGTS